MSTQAAKCVASISRLSAALDDLLVKRIYKEDDNDIASILHTSKLEADNKVMDEMAVLLKGLEVERVELEECMAKIVKAASKLEGLSEAAEGLLVEATRAKGSDFTFDQEMWATWSMDKFGESSFRCFVMRSTSHSAYLQSALFSSSLRGTYCRLNICTV